MRRIGPAITAATLITAILAGATGCGSDDKPAPKTGPVSSAQAADHPPLPVPSAADLNTGLRLALDPNTPRALKVDAVQGSDIDPELIDRMTEAAQRNGVTMTVTAVDYIGGGVAQASAQLTLNGEPVQGQALVPFVAEGGRWKLQRAWACQMLANAQVTSPACR